MKIAVGSDHVGFPLKNMIFQHLERCGADVIDCGAHDPNQTDYPHYAERVVKEILSGNAKCGILICGTGVGMSIGANKFHGIRAVVCSEPYSAIMSRKHNDANVLCMGGFVVGEGLAKLIVDQWLATEYEGGRHQNRLDLIKQFENGY